MLNRTLVAAALTAALSAALWLPPAALAADTVPPDPLQDKEMISAGFLQHHPDLRHRLLGMEAYRAGRYPDALQHFRRAGFYADKPAQGMVAEMYWRGMGAPRDPVMAYVWMDLAAERGYAGFLGLREQYWNALDAGERERAIAQGQAVYARFGDAAAKPRYEFQLRVGRREMTGSRLGFNRGVQIELPGPGGGMTIPGTRFHDERYWDAKQYWAWQDALWMRPKIGRVDVGPTETVRETVREPAAPSRIPATAPETDAPEPPVAPPRG